MKLNIIDKKDTLILYTMNRKIMSYISIDDFVDRIKVRTRNQIYAIMVK